MGLLSNNWAEIQNLHLQSLAANTSCKRWIYLLMIKLWYVAWYLWYFWNHTIHATDGPIKLEIIKLVHKRDTRNLGKGGIGIPTRCHSLFHTPTHTLLTCPIRQRLSWLVATVSARGFFRPHAPRRRLPDIDELLPGRITMGRLIPTLSQIDEDPQLQTTIVPSPSRSLRIEIEYDPNPLTHHDRNLSLSQA